jgi:hypothetical protein
MSVQLMYLCWRQMSRGELLFLRRSPDDRIDETLFEAQARIG